MVVNMVIVKFIIFCEEIIKLLLLYSGILKYKMVEKRKCYCVIGAAVAGEIVYLIQFNHINYNPVTAILLLLISIFCYEGKIGRKIKIFLPAYSVICILDMLLVSVERLILYQPEREIDGQDVPTILAGLLAILIIWAIIKFLGKGMSDVIDLMVSKWYFIGVIYGSCIFMTYSKRVLENSEMVYLRGLNVIYSSAWCSYFLICCGLVKSYNQKRELDTRLQTTQVLMNAKESYYQMVSQKDEELKRFRHDYKNHLALIKMLLYSKDYLKAEKYVESIYERSEGFQIRFETGNVIVDAIINDIAAKFKVKGIEFFVKGKLFEQLEISALDLTTIIYNAVMNAAEAASRENGPEKKVEIEVGKLGERCVFQIINPCEKEVVFKDGVIETTKEDKELHGFGMHNMKECIEKNDGVLQLQWEDKKFKTTIIFQAISDSE